MNHADEHSDLRIDQILHVLATTTAPTGLEQRIAARIAQHATHKADSRTHSSASLTRLIGRTTPFAIGLAALTALAVVLAVFLTKIKPDSMANQPHPPIAASQAGDLPRAIAAAESREASRSSEAPRPVEILRSPEVSTARPIPASIPVRLTAPGARPTSDRRAEGPTYTTIAASTDPDAIALAETFAPSHPVPPLPLTAQEALLLRSTRHGQPIEVAELETRRKSALIAVASAHEQSSLREYIHGLLGPLATAQALTPSSPPPQPDDTQPVAEPQTPSSK